MTAIEFRDVTINLGGREVLAKVNLAVKRGEFVGVFGPNGSGKTTLMRAILGLIPAAQGSIRVFDTAPTRGNHTVGYMPQLHSLPAGMHLRGWDFVAAAVRGYRPGLPFLDADSRRQVLQVLERVGGLDIARRPLGELSGGERQRLRLAQALLDDPKILLLDEPLITLDLNHQRTVIELAKSLQRDLDVTVLFSAHELNPLLGVIDRVLYLGSGHAALGTVDEIVTGPMLTKLYGAEIEVLRHAGRIFVMSGRYGVEQHVHLHNQGHGHDA